MKVLLCGYRDWALDVFKQLLARNVSIRQEHDFMLVVSNDELVVALEKYDFDLAFVVGWSWKIMPEHLAKVPFIGMHPSDLPAYAGGSPIQNQVLDGVTTSKATMFRLMPEMDSGSIVAQRPFSLEGHMADILQRLTLVTFTMCVELLDQWPDIHERPQVGIRDVRRRVRPEASRLDPVQLSKITCRQLWDVIRCREDPYPNAYFEDETGRLTIKRVEFEPK